MDASLALIVGLLTGLTLGALVGSLTARSRATARFAAQRTAEFETQAALRADLAAAAATSESLREHLAAMARQHTELQERQQAEASARLEREREEHRVLQALAPVRETLQSMQQKVAELETQRSQQYGSLAQQLEQAQRSDEQLRATTESLASALRSNSTRGVWGETQLRRVVEAAGLLQYVDFELQHSVSTDAGAGRPDMVVRLPGGKSIAIDAKVPLEHFLEASTIPLTANGAEAARRATLLDRHVKAMRSHIDALSKKTYWEGLDASPEFVIAFIPSESLLSSALEADPALLDHAFGRRVALASPVNLWAVLKTVAFTWQQQAVSDEAKKLFDLGNLLYQRLGNLAEHAESLRRSIERTVESYNRFAGSLESRVLVTARQFPGIDETRLALVDGPAAVHESPRRLSAAELSPAGTHDDRAAAAAEVGPASSDAARSSDPEPGTPDAVSDEDAEPAA